MKLHFMTVRHHTLLALAAVTVLSLATVMSAQTLFVSGGVSGDGAIFEITPGGTVNAFASGLEPYGLTFDGSGNLYVSNYSNSPGGGSILEITPGGIMASIVSGLNGRPIGLAFDSSGNLYFANQMAGTISEVTPGGTVTTFASGLYSPYGLVFDGSGNLYVSNALTAGGRISKITPGGTVTLFAVGLYNPQGVALDSSGNLYAVCSNFQGDGWISEITPAGTVSTFASGLPGAGQNFDGPTGLAVDGNDNLYVTNPSNGTISEITAGGTVTTFASGLNYPDAIAIEETAIPEPATFALLAGVAALGFVGWRRCRFA
jgi:sugar lactone lactonase YvrE